MNTVDRNYNHPNVRVYTADEMSTTADQRRQARASVHAHDSAKLRLAHEKANEPSSTPMANLLERDYGVDGWEKCQYSEGTRQHGVWLRLRNDALAEKAKLEQQQRQLEADLLRKSHPDYAAMQQTPADVKRWATEEDMSDVAQLKVLVENPADATRFYEIAGRIASDEFARTEAQKQAADAEYRARGIELGAAGMEAADVARLAAEIEQRDTTSEVKQQAARERAAKESLE